MVSPLDYARTMLGRGEVPDRGAIQDYLRTGGANLDPATTAWCAAFVNASLQKAGYKGTGSNMARSFMNYGTPTSNPQPGDLAVFARGPTTGHVGFFQGYDANGNIRVLGGNQGNRVAEGSYPTSSLLGFRHPGGIGSDYVASTNASGAPGAASPSGATGVAGAPVVGADGLPLVMEDPVSSPTSLLASLMSGAATGAQARQAEPVEQAPPEDTEAPLADVQYRRASLDPEALAQASRPTTDTLADINTPLSNLFTLKNIGGRLPRPAMGPVTG